MAGPNIELITKVAEALGDLRERLVFVGGCATGLLITDLAAASVRATQDVDAIVAIASRAEYRKLGKDLRARGFAQTLEDGEPPYRWTFAGMKLDVMPIDAAVLGFSNRWYEYAMQTAVEITLPGGLSIRMVTPPCFVATKTEAFLSRGKGDYLESHDLEDIISVVDGRAELVAEIAQAEPGLRRYLADAIGRLLSDDDFLNTLPGLVIEGSPQGRVQIVLERLRAIASIEKPELP